LTDPHSDGGGQVRYLQNLAGELVRLGHDVTIGCRAGSVLVEVARSTGAVAYDRFHFARGLRLSRWYQDIRTMQALLRDHSPDVVHVSGSQDHWVAALARLSTRADVPVIRTRHNTYPVKRGVLNRLLNRNWTTHQITVCDMVRETLSAHPAFDSARLTSIHNGVDTALYHPDMLSRADSRAQFDYGDEHIVCGIAARLVKAKGHTFLFQAIRTLRDEMPQLRVLVLGQGALEAALRDEVKALGLQELVTFAGFREDMPRCVQAFDIGILPSIDCDTSSFSLKEQMAAGIPVVASDYGGLPEIVTNNVEGLIVPNGTVAPLADAIRTLAQDGARRGSMGKLGRERVLRDFSLETFASRTVDVYHHAIALRTGDAMDTIHEHTTP